MPDLYYHETFTAGRWWPRTSSEPPKLDRNGRQIRSDGVGKRVRAVHKVPPYLHHLTLNQMRELFSPQGKFRMTMKEKPSE